MKDDERIIKATKRPATISIGVTFVDGRILFKNMKTHSMFWYGICNYGRSIFAVSPLDYERVTMITTIRINTQEFYCERAFSCLNFPCILNQFDRGIYAEEFKDCGLFSLGMPQDIGKKPLWFSIGEFKDFWAKFIIPIKGGILRYDEEKAKKVLNE